MKNNRYLISILEKMESAKKFIKMRQSTDSNSFLDDESYSAFSYLIVEVNKHLSDDCYCNSDDYRLYMTCKRAYMKWSGGIW